MENVSMLTEEYETLLCEQLKEFSPDDIEACNAIKELLQKEADWTQQGASTVLDLALNYGSFVLKNALALSIALKIEDGEYDI